ncbi:CLUMA_CG010203, isoform A [Clunio marinus]|uniref:CLUMA_CG010203, isoform A n=1 Tax=Clunio marinus TaxID=568069 RepID=A0A1J1IAI2_9DIPT|nr:CLUMA_CG010203, isoform A [Clunio marinus]
MNQKEVGRSKYFSCEIFSAINDLEDLVELERKIVDDLKALAMQLNDSYIDKYFTCDKDCDQSYLQRDLHVFKETTQIKFLTLFKIRTSNDNQKELGRSNLKSRNHEAHLTDVPKGGYTVFPYIKVRI